MKLRDQLHEAIDALDNQGLALVYTQVQILLKRTAKVPSMTPVPSIDVVADMIQHDTTSWSRSTAFDRDERL